MLVWRNALPDGVALSAFNDMFVLDGMATILKLFILLVTIAVCLYGRVYLRDRKLLIGEFYLLILFAYARHDAAGLGRQPDHGVPRPRIARR